MTEKFTYRRLDKNDAAVLLVGHQPERTALALLRQPPGLDVGRIDPLEMPDRMSGRRPQ